MRFTYNMHTALVLENQEVNFISGLKFKDDHKEILKNYNKVKVENYKEFLAVIAKETSEKIEKNFYVMLSEGHILLAVSGLDNVIRAKAFYKPENDEILNLIIKLTTVTDGSGKVIIGNINNDFNFLTSRTILNVLFTAANVRAKGEPLYHEFKIKSKNGKVRNIVAPNEELKKELQVLNGVLQYIFDKVNIDFQVAYKKDKNIADNANIHKDKKFIYNVDLKDFYPSCKEELVDKHINFFFKNSFNGDVTKREFLDIILHNGALFIGSPISGTLANIIISKPVNYMRNIAKNFNMEFSVYADDMTFSSDRYISRELVENVFSLAFTRYNLDHFFKLNQKKFHGMSNNRRRITGVTINHEDKLTVSRSYYRDLRVKIHKLSIGETNNINLQKLRGKFAFALMIDQSEKIYRLIKKFESTVTAFNLVSQEKLAELDQARGGI